VSCGNPHETPCDEVLAEVFLFLDNECDPTHRSRIQQHLEECGPCLRKYGIEDEVKELVHRKCGGDRAPDSLKQRVRFRLTEVVVETTTVEIRTD
jgi:mycothiol system anti-sigma-R factor